MTAKAKRLEPIRRANKPLMEKRRRARINQSLAALKTLILDTAKADNTKHSKLEKADILELTVRHFQRHRSLDVKGINQYKSGYADCVREVQRYLDTPDAQTMTVIDSGVRQRLLRHLDNCVSEVDVDLRQAVSLTSVATPSSLINNNVDERLQQQQQHPDSSTLEEVNNNTNNNNNLHPQIIENNTTLHPNNNNNNNNNRKSEPPPISVGGDDPKTIKNYDGNFVLLLPEHYVQLANALGVNLRQAPSPGPSTSENLNNVDDDVKSKMEKPLDFSKNNDQVQQENMWRPW